jgi:hypothetical protein
LPKGINTKQRGVLIGVFYSKSALSTENSTGLL